MYVNIVLYTNRTRPVAKLQVSLNASRTISITELACHYNGEARAWYSLYDL